jgi:hypothetical protein
VDRLEHLHAEGLGKIDCTRRGGYADGTLPWPVMKIWTEREVAALLELEAIQACTNIEQYTTGRLLSVFDRFIRRSEAGTVAADFAGAPGSADGSAVIHHKNMGRGSYFRLKSHLSLEPADWKTLLRHSVVLNPDPALMTVMIERLMDNPMPNP